MNFIKDLKNMEPNHTIIVVILTGVLCGLSPVHCAHQAASSSLTGEGSGPNAAVRTLSGINSQWSDLTMTANSLKVLGGFSNIKHVGDHVDGYALQLWQQGSQIFGLFVAHSGQTGDSPTGLVEDIKFNPRTKQLSFKARLSTGLISKGDYRGVPSRDVFHFKGTLRRNEVTGVLGISDALFPNEPAPTKRIVLRKSAAMTQVMMAPATYAEWKTWADEILKRLGPKW
jgi:hypothetical protein